MPRPLPNAAAAAAKWKEGMLRLSTPENAQKMVDNITVNPMEKAAAQADHWFNRVSAPEAKTRFKKRLTAAAANLPEYKALTKAGVVAVRGKLNELEKKMGGKYDKLFTHMNPILTTVRAMPTGKGDYDTSPNIKRFEKYTREMMKIKDKD